MESRKYSSSREEALEIALHTRRSLLQSKPDVVSILRACYLIATNLNNKDAINWIQCELSGYDEDS